MKSSLRQSAEFQRSLLQAIHDASPDGILVVDDHGIIVSHNRRFLELWEIGDETGGKGNGAATAWRRRAE